MAHGIYLHLLQSLEAPVRVDIAIDYPHPERQLVRCACGANYERRGDGQPIICVNCGAAVPRLSEDDYAHH